MKIMPAGFVLFFSFLFLVGFPLSAHSSLETSAPPQISTRTIVSSDVLGAKIQFAAAEFNFGRAIEGAVIQHEFAFTNGGDAALEVTSVEPSCGCTTVGNWSRRVDPGKTGAITLEFNTAGHVGGASKMAAVTTNDKDRPKLWLTLRGAVLRPVDVIPSNAALYAVADSSVSAATTVRITNNLDRPLRLSNPESSTRAFTAQLRTLQPGKEFELTVKTVPPLRAGEVRGKITLKSSAKEAPEIGITATAVIRPAVAVP